MEIYRGVISLSENEELITKILESEPVWHKHKILLYFLNRRFHRIEDDPITTETISNDLDIDLNTANVVLNRMKNSGHLSKTKIYRYEHEYMIVGKGRKGIGRDIIRTYSPDPPDGEDKIFLKPRKRKVNRWDLTKKGLDYAEFIQFNPQRFGKKYWDDYL